MSSRRKREIKRKLRVLRSEHKYFRTALRDIKDDFELYKSEWNTDFNTLVNKFQKSDNSCTKTEKIISQIDEKQGDNCYNRDENKEKINKNNAPKWAKSLYKKIARKTHPDVAREIDDIKRMSSIFQDAAKIIESADYEKLFDIAIDLGISVDLNEEELVVRMKKIVAMLREEISKIEDSPAWVWGESFGMDDIRLKVAKISLESISISVEDKKLLASIKEIESNI